MCLTRLSINHQLLYIKSSWVLNLLRAAFNTLNLSMSGLCIVAQLPAREAAAHWMVWMVTYNRQAVEHIVIFVRRDSVIKPFLRFGLSGIKENTSSPLEYVACWWVGMPFPRGWGGMRLPSKWHPSVCDFLLLLNERWRVFANVGLEGIAVIRQSSNFSMIWLVDKNGLSVAVGL